MKERLKALWHAFSTFSDREGRRVLLLVPLLAALSLLFLWLDEPRFDRGFTQYAGAADSVRRASAGKYSAGRNGVSGPDVLSDSVVVPGAAGRSADDGPFFFDPNTVTGDELERLGFTPKQAAVILRYRNSGAVFRRPEDFARCYTVSDRAYRRLVPYIRIAPAFAHAEDGDGKLSEGRSQGECRSEGASGPDVLSDSVAAFGTADRFADDGPFFFDPNTVTGDELERLGFTPKQAAVILRYRNSGAVFRRPEDFARCYTVSDRTYRRLAPYIRIASAFARADAEEPTDRLPRTADTASVSDVSAKGGAFLPAASPSVPVELNGADSVLLTTLRGIGPLTAGRIVRYRERLGGYVAVEQLREIEGMTDRNFDLISQQIRVESSKIRKIDINFAHPSAMKGHPYLTDRVLNRILKYRQLKGGWRSIEDLTEGHILTTEEADRLSPYLCFETK